MIMRRGFLEILEMIGSNETKHFNDFTRISIGKRKLSSATVSKRLDELIAVKVIDEAVSRSKTGRRIIAYRSTAKGKLVLELSRELQEALAAPKAK